MSSDHPESHGGGGFIYALMYCKFDQEKGPRIVCTDPPGVFEGQFHLISKYFLPNREINGKVISMRLDHWRVMGVPMQIEGHTYSRNNFQYVLCLIVDATEKAIHVFRSIAIHIAAIFHSLETEVSFLSQIENEDWIGRTLHTLRRQLNSHRQGEPTICHLHIDSWNNVCFVARPTHEAPQDISIAQVPLPLVELTQLVCGGGQMGSMHLDLDLTLMQVLPFIDGMASVRDIARRCQVEENDVKKCLQHLLYYGLIKMIDTFAMTNIYRLNAHSFLTCFADPAIRKQAPAYVVGGPSVEKSLAAKGVRPIPVCLLQRLYCDIRESGTHVKTGDLNDFCSRNAALLSSYGLSPRHLIAFGRRHGFIDRVHEYPVITTAASGGAAGGGGAGAKGASTGVGESDSRDSRAAKVKSMCEGRHHLDYIQTVMGMDRQGVMDLLDAVKRADPSMSLVWIRA